MKTFFDRVRPTVLSLAVAGALPALAQIASVPATKLPATVVTASRNSQLPGSALPHTTVITRQDIERSQAVDLVTLLVREPGLQKNSKRWPWKCFDFFFERFCGAADPRAD